MRIALVTDWFLPRLGGIELHVRDLAVRLAERGHEVTVLTTTPAGPERQGRLQARALPVPEGVEVRRLDVLRLPGSGLAASPRLPAAAADALDAVGPELVHVHAGVVPPLALAAGWAAHRRGLPVVATFHSVLGPVRGLWRGSDALLGWSRWADVLAGVSPSVAAEIESVTGAPVRVLPNGVDADAWAPPPDAGDVAPGAPDELRLVSVMRLQRRKRGRALLDVVAGAARRLGEGRRVSLVVAGEGPERRRLEDHARRLGVADRVSFAGYRDRDALRELFARSDAFVLASVMESFGLAALEARAAGLAVVARGDSGVAAHVEDGVEGLLAGSDRELEDAVVRLGREPEALRAIRDHNRRTRTPWDWSAVTAIHLEAYGDAVTGEPGTDVGAGVSDAPARPTARP